MDSENRGKVAKLEQLLENVRERAHGTPEDDLTGVVGASLYGRESSPDPAPFSEPIPDHISTLPPPPMGVAPPPIAPLPPIGPVGPFAVPSAPAPAPAGSSPDIDALDVAWDDDATVIARMPLSYDIEDRVPAAPRAAAAAAAVPATQVAPAPIEPLALEARIPTPPPAPPPAPPAAPVARTTLVPPRTVTTYKPPAPVAPDPAPEPRAPVAAAAPRLSKKERRAHAREAARVVEDKAVVEARAAARREKVRAKEAERKERARSKEAARKAKAKTPLHEQPRDPKAPPSDLPPPRIPKAARVAAAERTARVVAKRADEAPPTLAGRMFGTARDRAQWKMLGLIVAVVAAVAAVGVALSHR